jgi:hypothetical protein
VTVAARLDSAFDFAYTNGLIHHMMCHPRLVDWQTGAVPDHLDHVGGRGDVWYAGFGQLYAYHYMVERGVVELLPPGAGLEPEPGNGWPPAASMAAPRLLPIAPSPLAGSAWICFELPAAAAIRLGIYDATGRQVRRLAEGLPCAAGRSGLRWDARRADGSRLPGGVYFLRLVASEATATRKLVLLD